jgi:hypothetical protein
MQICVEGPGGSYFNYIMATSFSGGISRSTRREPPTMGKQLVNFITCGLSLVHPFCNFQRQGWFSPGTPAYSTTKTGHHDIAEILLKVVLNTKNQSSQIKTQLLSIDGIIMYVYFLEPLVLLS